MNRLPLELHRLYVPQASGSADAEAAEPRLTDADGRVRAMVLTLARPADWDAVSRVWNGAQSDLELPAAAIAVSGTDAYQLWFSLREPVPAPLAWAFLEGLRVRYLGDLKAERVGLLPRPDSALPPQEINGRWSAFVAPDLAPMFAEEPWLDMPPNDDGQSRLLSRLRSIGPADFQRALAQLGAVRTPPSPGLAPVGPPADSAGAGLEPRAFLLGVMNDDSVALGLRIEAAKALLHDTGSHRQR